MINVAICQSCSSGTTDNNQKMMIEMVEKAVSIQPNLDLIIFPEYAYFSPANIEESLAVAIDLSKNHPFIEAMKGLAKKYGVNLIPGSFVEKAEGNKVHNASIFIDRNGEIKGKYRKIHLFDAASYKESSYVEAGGNICLIDTDFGKIGLMVCYDLRFPEQARTMCLKGAEIIVVPSMFPSGQPLPPRVDDWDILVQSAALTNLTYVVAANQYGSVHKENLFGRSCVVDPRGVIIAAASGRSDIVIAAIDLEYQKEVQENLAVWKNRRSDVYEL